jgi:hypothetical protein
MAIGKVNLGMGAPQSVDQKMRGGGMVKKLKKGGASKRKEPLEEQKRQ